MAGLYGTSDLNLGGSLTSQMLRYSAYLPPKYLQLQQHRASPLSHGRQYYGERASPYKREGGSSFREFSRYTGTPEHAQGDKTANTIDLNDSGHFSDLSDVDLDESSVLHSEASGSGIREGTGQTSQVANLLLQREIKTEKWDSPPLSPRQNPHLAAARSLAPPQGTVSTSSYIPPINVPALSAHLPSVFNGPIFSQPPSVGLPHLYRGYSLMGTGRYATHPEHAHHLHNLPHLTQTERFSPYTTHGLRAVIGQPAVQPICIEPQNLMPVSQNPFKETIHAASLRGLPGCPPGTHGTGPIKLWQFLLELLTDRTCQHCIAWTGDGWEFRLINPDEVARLWGIRKNKPRMNYEKLSRGIRYYYEKRVISKTVGKRYVYRFVIDIKDVLGCGPEELWQICGISPYRALEDNY